LIMKPFRSIDLLSIFDKIKIIEEKAEFDFSSIEKMTFGDQQMLEKILTRFKKDCIDDAESLKNHIHENDQDKSRLIVHRLAGRTAQMGSKNLANAFRTLELEIAKKGLSSEINAEIFNQLKKLEGLIKAMDEMELVGED